MSSIRLIEVPPGPAPKYIRIQWLGVLIPMPSEEELATVKLSEFRIGSENIGGYLVYSEAAIKSLRDAGKHEAANWWAATGIGKFLQFKKEVCEVID